MRLAQIEVSKIDPNEGNPRGIDIPLDDPKLSYLKDSISTFGVLVPLVVAKRGERYVLIDGERRYWASKSVQLDKVPAYIVDEDGSLSDDELLYRMFQIHHNHEQWGPVQQCNALEAVYKRIARQSKIVNIKDARAKVKAIAEELVKKTGIEERTAANRAYFLLWPEDVKSKLYADPKEQGYWYICEIEEKIIIPALTNYPEYFEKVPVEEVRRDLFKKLEHHSAEKSTEVRRVAPFFRTNMTRETDRKKIKGVLAHLHKDIDNTYESAQDELVQAFPELMKTEPVSPRRLHSLIQGLQQAVENFDYSSFDTAKRRAKASRADLVKAVSDLIESLGEFSAQLKSTKERE